MLHFIRFCLFSWLFALLCYALLTLPALFEPVIYVISLVLAAACSIPALALFALAAWCGASGGKLRDRWQQQLLGGILLTLLATGLATWYVTSGEDMLRAYGQFFLFPLAAGLSAWMGIYLSRSHFYRFYRFRYLHHQ